MRGLREGIHLSIMRIKREKLEFVCRAILNKLGYPNNIEIITFQQNNDVHFIDSLTNEVVAKVELRDFVWHVWLCDSLSKD